GACVHGAWPAGARGGLRGGWAAGLRVRDRTGAPARAEPGHGARPQGPMNEFRHLYIHLPFCRHKCGYCDFNAYAGMDRLMPDYVDALERELVFARERYPFQELDSVYLGGGTPSLLQAQLMARLLAFIRRTFNVAPDAEVTLEANP